MSNIGVKNAAWGFGYGTTNSRRHRTGGTFSKVAARRRRSAGMLHESLLRYELALQKGKKQ